MEMRCLASLWFGMDGAEIDMARHESCISNRFSGHHEKFFCGVLCVHALAQEKLMIRYIANASPDL